MTALYASPSPEPLARFQVSGCADQTPTPSPAYFVRSGQMVRRGEVIGRVGATGRTTSSHLHYEVRYRGTSVNPYKYLKNSSPQSASYELAD